MIIIARPRKLLNSTTKNYTNEEKEAKEKEEEVLYNYEKLDFSYYPPGLLKEAFNEWNRIGAYIGDLPISELDMSAMIRYCNYTHLYAQATEQVNMMGAVDPETGKANPWVAAMNSYSKELKAATNDLGLTINSRMKLILPAEKEKEVIDPFTTLFE